MQFLLPDIGEGVAEGEIVKWHVSAGQRVDEEQDFVEVMTDKATVMIPCPVTGVLGELLAEEGEIVAVHAPIASFTSVEGGHLAGAHGAAAAPASAPAAAQAGSNGNGNGQASAAVATQALLPEPAARVLATPATRRRAREQKVDIRRVKGTGPHGRVTREDVERSVGAPAAPAPSRAASPGPVPEIGGTTTRKFQPLPELPLKPLPATPVRVQQAGAAPAEERVPLRGVRRKIAEFLSHSKRTAAHYTYVEEVDVTELVALRKRCKPRAAEQGVNLTYLPFIVKALTGALRKHPSLNASLDDVNAELVYKNYYNIGIAADTDQGLVVPVLRDANQLSVLQIASEIRRLAEGARNLTLPPEDMSGGTFTITSAGHIGGLLATPILNWPEVGILGVHKIKRRPVVVSDEAGGETIGIRDILYLSLSLDHRVVDGANAARFMNDLIRPLEDPELFILEGN